MGLRYVDEFRDPELAHRLAAAIRSEVEPARTYHLMEFCGGHTHAIFRYGVQALLPENIRLVHGPGCPVCVLPVSRLQQAMAMVQAHDVMLCCYGDVLRVPAANGRTLLNIKATGADIRMVYSTQDAIQLAAENPDRKVVFFAIGFETTTPPTALAVQQARQRGLSNFTVFCNHVITPAAIRHILDAPQLRELEPVRIDGFLGPSHVSTIIGSQPYEYFAEEFQRPVVIAGFEPLDVMHALLMLLRQLNQGRFEVENQYTRLVTRQGNRRAQQIVAEVFELRRAFEWRGLGQVPYSALRIKSDYRDFDAEERFPVMVAGAADPKGCLCPAILRGAKRPTECELFGTACTPEHPKGACMVSSEGACAAYWRYGRFQAAG